MIERVWMRVGGGSSYPGYSQSTSTPSAPVSSIIFCTLLENRVRLSFDFAASENPSVFPQPPMATMIFVPLENLARVSDTVVKSGHSEG